jgi:hypothetical protein
MKCSERGERRERGREREREREREKENYLAVHRLRFF